MEKIKNKTLKSVLLDRDGFTITIRQAQWKIRRLKMAKARDPELFELNGGWHDLLLLYQFVEQNGKWNGEKNKLEFLSEAERQLLYCKVERVTPETYPCGVLIQALEV